MPKSKVILLACGSFNPPTNMHLRMFEIARDHLHRMGSHEVIGGLISPVHDSYGKRDLEASTHRLAMVKLALQTTDWIKVSDFECKQESWTRTRRVLENYQNHVNALLQSTQNHNDDDENNWIPEDARDCAEPVKIKLLCGADLLESFGTPGLWADEDIDAIVGEHGLIVITRSKTNPLEFIYNSDMLTKYMANITIVTEWIQNEVSSTKIRRALCRSESVKYLLPDKVIDYIHKHSLYGSKFAKYLRPFEFNSNFLTPSPSDVTMESPSPLNHCMIMCNNALFSKRLSIDTVDHVTQANVNNSLRHPGQAVKIITDLSGNHNVLKADTKPKEVGKEEKPLKSSKSCVNLNNFNEKSAVKSSKSNANLKEGKSCDENLIQFIFTKHGIQVISDVETIV